MRPFEKATVILGVLVVVAAILLIRLTVPSGEGRPQLPKPPQSQAPRPPTMRQGRRSADAQLRGLSHIANPGKKNQTPVAEVNGVILTEYDVFGYRDAERVAKLTARDPDFPALMLDWAVRRELLCQFAEETGVDQSPEYLQEKEEREHEALRMRLNYLVSLYERESEELQALKESIEVTEADVREFYSLRGGKPGDKNEEKIKAEIRKRLPQGKYLEAYKVWLLEEMADVPILVNGRQIPEDLLNEGLDAMIPPEITVGDFPAHGLGQDFGEFVLHAAGIREPSAASWQQLLDTELQIGSKVLTIGDLYPPLFKASMRSDSRNRAFSRPPSAGSLMRQIKSIMLAEKAVEEGLGHELQEYIKVDPELRAPDPRDLLAAKVWEDLGLHTLDTEAFTEEEVQAHIGANPAHYSHLLTFTNGAEAARKAARHKLARELQRQERGEFTDALKADAVVNILDDRFR